MLLRSCLFPLQALWNACLLVVTWANLAIPEQLQQLQQPQQPQQPSRHLQSSLTQYYWDDFSTCREFLRKADLNRDGIIDQNEFVILIVELVFGANVDQVDFLQLPGILVPIFLSYAENEEGVGVDIAALANDDSLNQFCQEVGVEIAIFQEEGWEIPSPSSGGTGAPAFLSYPSPSPAQFVQTLQPTSYDNLIFWEDPMTCQRALARADTTRDAFLDQYEYPRFIQRFVDPTQTGLTIDSLAPEYREIYLQGAGSNGLFVGFVNEETIADGFVFEQARELCASLREVLDDLQRPSPTPSPATGSDDTINSCLHNLTLSDRNWNNLLEQDEFVRFINRRANYLWHDVPFEDLPLSLQQVYLSNVWEDRTGVDIFGARPNQQRSEKQAIFLRDFCSAATSIVDDELMKPPAPSLAPVAAPTDFEPWSLQFCFLSLTVADLNRNQILEPIEYVRLINRGTSNNWQSFLFIDIPAALQENFNRFADGGMGVDISGSRPEQTATKQQALFLEAFCNATSSVLDEFLNSPTPASSPAPVPAPTTPPYERWTIDECLRALLIANLNRNVFLEDVEYVRFVNRGGNQQWQFLLFLDLPTILQDNYNAFLVPGSMGVDISGSRLGEQPSRKQALFLGQFCNATSLALEKVLGVISPSQSPSVLVVDTPTSLAPSLILSRGPSATPSLVVSSHPTHVPPSMPPSFLLPSMPPSLLPSMGATSNNPTLLPSSLPTAGEPSLLPSTGPTTMLPSASPSAVLSMSPSNLPTVSLAPSSPPSDVPSNTPSSSTLPSTVPSDMPSDLPSDVPSDLPSNVPSETLSDLPSEVSSNQPTDFQTANETPTRGQDSLISMAISRRVLVTRSFATFLVALLAWW